MQEDKEVIKKESTEENANESMSFWDHLEVLRWAFSDRHASYYFV